MGSEASNLTAIEPIRIYIAHLFSEHEDFHKVIEYVEAKDSFMYINSANPDGKPQSGGPEAVQEEFRKQIGLSEVMIVPVNIYKENQEVIDYQIRIAENFNIPVLGIQSFGCEAEVPKSLRDNCREVVEWETRRMVTAIKSLARNEVIPEYEVIEFTLD